MSVFTAAALAAPIFPTAEPTGDDAWLTAAYIAIGAAAVFVVLALLLRKTPLLRNVATTAVLVCTVGFILLGFIGVTVEAREIAATERQFSLEVSNWLRDDYGIITPANNTLTQSLKSLAPFEARRDDGSKPTIAFVKTDSGEVAVVDSAGNPIAAN
ncbi:MAG: hypothetical protein JWQ43_1667 [Glaciihabitans sp.]|nr:hypothetical protein [Glaciihabitans sp.]